MGNKMKGVLLGLISVLLILEVVPDFIPDISTAAATVTDNASNPSVLRTLFNFWWFPVGLYTMETLFPGTMKKAWSKVSGSFRRKR